jgi:transposase
MYVFLGRTRDRIKLVYWDNDGIAIWMKRLEAGVFRVELSAQGSEEILTGVDLKALLSGTELSRIKLSKNAEKGLYS